MVSRADRAAVPCNSYEGRNDQLEPFPANFPFCSYPVLLYSSMAVPTPLGHLVPADCVQSAETGCSLILYDMGASFPYLP